MRSRSRPRDPCRHATTQDTNCRDHLPCHPERSEGSARVAAEIPRCARDGSAHRMNRLIDDRTTRLFIALAAFFCVNAVLAEFIGVKIFALEDTLGIQPLEWNLFGQSGSPRFTAGTLLWPHGFFMTPTRNQYFGRPGLRVLSWLGA